MLSIGHDIDIHKKCICVQKSKPVIVLLQLLKYHDSKKNYIPILMLKTFKKEIESFTKVDT